MEFEPKRLKEVHEILKHFPMDEINKIPKNVFEYLNDNMDDEYEYQFDINKKIYEQNINPDTLSLLLYICKEYMYNGQQNDFLNRLEQIDIAQGYKKNTSTEYNKQMFGNKQ